MDKNLLLASASSVESLKYLFLSSWLLLWWVGVDAIDIEVKEEADYDRTGTTLASYRNMGVNLDD